VQKGFPELVNVVWVHFQFNSFPDESMYPGLAEKRFVSRSLIIQSLLMLCSAMADLSVCVSRELCCSLNCVALCIVCVDCVVLYIVCV
jgi:hypothetical protein